MQTTCVAVTALLLAAVVGAYDTNADAYLMTPGSGRVLQSNTCRHPNIAGTKHLRDPVQLLVQFSTVVTDATLRAFAKVVPGRPQHFDVNVITCVGDGSVLDRALQFPGVLRVTEREPLDRVAPGTPKNGHYYVKCVADYCLPIMQALDRMHVVYRLTHTKLLVWPGSHTFEMLVHNPHVLSIEPKPQWKPLNAGGRDVLTQGIKLDSYNRAHSRTTKFLQGEGEIVTVADTGVDMNNCFFAQEGGAPLNTVDFNRSKVIAILSGSCSTCWGAPACTGFCGDGEDNNNGHGTHVAGSVAGRAPGLPQNINNGMAAGAKIIMQDMEDAQSKFNVPSDITDLLKPAYDLGSRIHTNSWGCAIPEGAPPDFCNRYNSNAVEIDEFVAKHPDMLVLVAAGNDGALASSFTVGAPATCKNCISVGATVLDPAQNAEATHFMNPYKILCPPWDKETVPCCKTPQGCSLADCCTAAAYGETCCPEHYAAFKTSQLAQFSSTGPTRDGRFKPDLACPGRNIASAYASKTATSPFCLPPDPGLSLIHI